MTRKDYILIANALRYDLGLARNRMLREDTATYGIEYAAEGLAVALASDNPRFDREHFLAVVRGERAADSRPPRRKMEGTE